jgi:hypothetical protein
VDQELGWCACHGCEEIGSPSSVHLPQRRFDGDQDRPVQQALSPIESWIYGLHEYQGFILDEVPKASPAGTSRYWGVIAYSKTGRSFQPIEKAFLLGVGFLVLVTIVCTAVAILTVGKEPEHYPVPVIQHQPSDLDKGSIPSSSKYGKLGEPGPQGPRGEPGVTGIDGPEGLAIPIAPSPALEPLGR